jgi:uncharacterized membrane protein YecN with MAPEG domain
MGFLSFLDVAWRVVLAGALALTPGIMFWSLVLGLVAVVSRLRHHYGLARPASGVTPS